MVTTGTRPMDSELIAEIAPQTEQEGSEPATLKDMVQPASTEPLRQFNLEESTHKILRHCRRTVADIVEIGRELNWAKANLEHGLWEKWVEENLPFSTSTARKFVEAAKEFDKRSLTNDSDERQFLREIWGNKPRTEGNEKEQEATGAILEKRFKKSVSQLREVVRQLNFIAHWPPALRDQLTLLRELVTNQEAYWRDLDTAATHDASLSQTELPEAEIRALEDTR